MNTQPLGYELVTKFVATLEKFYTSFFVVLSLSLASSLMAVLYPLLFKAIVDEFQKRQLLPLLIFLGIYALIQIFQNTINSMNNFIRKKYALKANKKVIHQFYGVVQALPLKIFRKFQHNGEIYQRVIDSLELNYVVIDVASGLIINFLNLIIYIGILFYIHWMVGSVIIVLMPFYYLLNRIFISKKFFSYALG